MKAKVQVIIPAINLWEKYSKGCIASVKRMTDSRILFIDNNSDDWTREEAGKLVSDNFAHKRNDERWSFSRSVNYGVNDAFQRGCTHALVLNNDVVVHPKMMDRMLERFEKGGVGMVTAMDVRGECVYPIEVETKDDKEKEEVLESEHPNFSAFMISKECWEEVGEFDEGFLKAYWEDNDFHMRMNILGTLAIAYPPALFYHYGSGTQNEALGKDNPIVRGYEFEQNKDYMFRKWGSYDAHNINYRNPFNDSGKTIKSTRQNPYAK